MIAGFRRSLSREESGQAIILGAVSLLVLAVGIMTTAQLGWAIKEKIQTQHAADNAAYSSAVLVARSLNFISWSNRAMIAQYASAMAFQSLTSVVDGIVVMAGQVVAMLFSVAFILGVVGRILQVIPWTTSIGSAAVKAANAIGDFADRMRAVLRKDGVIGMLANLVDEMMSLGVKLSVLMNKALYAAQYVARAHVVAEFGMGAAGVNTAYAQALQITGRKPSDDAFNSHDVNINADVSAYDMVPSVVNAVLYAGGGIGTLVSIEGLFDTKLLSLFDGPVEGSEAINKQEDEKTKRAERVMTELANASRVGLDGKSWESKHDFGLSRVIDIIVSMVSGDEPSGDWGSVGDFISMLAPDTQGGTLLGRVADDEQTLRNYLSGTDTTLKPKGARNHACFGKDGGDADKNTCTKEGSPVFSTAAYYKKESSDNASYGNPISAWPRGRALITSEYIDDGFMESFPGFFEVIFSIMSAGGELPPKAKLTGIHSTEKEDLRMHCKFGDVSMLNEESMCDKVADAAKEGCENESGNNPHPCQDCSGKTEQELADCQAANEGCHPEPTGSCSDRAREAKQDCLDGVNNGGDAGEKALRELFGGFPARVVISCNEDYEKERKRHSYSLSKYISFNIENYKKNQADVGSEEYPSFFGLAHKNPKFLPKNVSALGFGEKFESDNFKMSSVGVVEGPTARPQGDCDSQFNIDGKGCISSDEGYNFNHMSNGAELITPGFHAIARAQAYYHRPGAWAEPPNLFNPYWKAKLSPVAPLLTNSVNSIAGSLGPIGQFIGGHLSGVVQAILSH